MKCLFLRNLPIFVAVLNENQVFKTNAKMMRMLIPVNKLKETSQISAATIGSYG